MAGDKSKSVRKRVKAETETTPMKRAKDGSAFIRCDKCDRDVPVALLDMHNCSLEAKIKLTLETEVETAVEPKKSPTGMKATPSGSKDKGSESKGEKATSSGSKDKGSGSKDKGSGLKGNKATLSGSKDKGSGLKGKKATSSRSKDKGSGSKGKKAKDPNAPKRPMTSFFLFMEDFRKEYGEANPDAKKGAAVVGAGGERWKVMTDEEKKVYVDRAAELKGEYENAMANYNAQNDGNNENAENGENDNNVENAENGDDGKAEIAKHELEDY